MNLSDITEIYPDIRKYGKSELIVDDTISTGVELELENVRPIDYTRWELSKYWDVKDDHSLRGGFELIFKYPFRGNDIALALDELRILQDTRSEPFLVSSRCSMHVHIDVRDWTVERLQRFVALFVIYEPTLFAIWGAGRERNNFCQTVDAINVKNALARLYTGNKPSTQQTLKTWNKYSSINLLTSMLYGSVEIRVHKGTSDPDEVLEWINVLLCMAKESNTEFDVNNILQNASGEGSHRMTDRIFMQYAEKMFIPKFNSLFYKGLRNFQDILIMKDIYQGSLFNPDNIPYEYSKGNITGVLKPFLDKRGLYELALKKKVEETLTPTPGASSQRPIDFSRLRELFILG